MRRAEFRASVAKQMEVLSGLQVDLERLLTVLDENAGMGYPSGAGMDGGGRPSGPSSSVERAAFAHDPAADAKRRMVDGLRQSYEALVNVVDPIRRHWMTEGKRPNEGGVAGCVVMAEVGVWEPASVTDCRGNLDEPMLLGVWARRFTIRAGRLPTRAEAEAHSQGRDVRVA